MSGGSDVNWSAVGSVAGGIGGFLIGGPAGAAVGMSLGAGIGAIAEGPPPGPDTSFMRPGAGEQGLEARLAEQAAGTGGPSAAEMQLQRGTDMANRNAMALAASQRGISPGLAASIASRQQGMNQVEANQQAGLMRAQESLAANQLLASVYSSQRGSAAQAAQLQSQADAARRAREDQIISSIGGAGVAYLSGGGAGAAPVGPTAQPMAGQPAGDFSGFAKLGAEVATPEQMLAGSQVMDRQYQRDQQRTAFSNAYMNAYKGALVPGKAKTKGDSIKNDTVLIAASPGEMVIPRTVVQRGPEAISEFAKALIGKDYSNAKKA